MRVGGHQRGTTLAPRTGRSDPRIELCHPDRRDVTPGIRTGVTASPSHHGGPADAPKSAACRVVRVSGIAATSSCCHRRSGENSEAVAGGPNATARHVGDFGNVVGEMSTEPVIPSPAESLELPVPELLRRARPLPPRDEMQIDDLSEEEGLAFLAALEA